MHASVALRVAEDVYEALREVAAAVRRPLSKFIEIAALAQSRTAQFVDDAEAVAILSDGALVQRMTSGSRRARCHWGDIAHGACTGVDRWRHILEPPQSESRCC